MRRLDLMLFIIVVAIILLSLLRAVSGSPQGKQHEPRRGPAAVTQTAAKRG